MNDNANSLKDDLVSSMLKESRSNRRWRNIRFFIIALFIAFIFISIHYSGSTSEKAMSNQPYVSLVRMSGIIMPGASFSASNVIPALQKAFADKKAKGVILLINSGGGSPVQSAIIHDKIMELKAEYKKKVVVVSQDTLASGAYLVATAADKIYVNPDTITGSIGVIMQGFGFTDVIKKLGVTRRVYTAGSNKNRLDSFEPVSVNDKVKIASILKQAHQNFIQYVLQGRGKKLHGDPSELFSGDFWLGQKAKKLGLVDGTANLWQVTKKEFGVQYYHDYTHRPSLLSDLTQRLQTALHVNFSARYSGPSLMALVQ